MADKVFEHQVDVLSGAAEARLQDEKFQLIIDRSRQKENRLLKRSTLAAMETPPSGVLPTIAALTQHELRRYSLKNLISSLAGFQEMGLEGEISASISRDLGSAPSHGGVWLPYRMASGLDTKTNAAGGYEVATKISTSIIDALRAQTAVLRLGATFLGGLRYDFALPIESNVLAGNWVQDDPGIDVAQSNPSLGVRTLCGHPLQATCAISRQLLRQSTPDLEAWLGSRIAKSHGVLLDQAALHGTGTNNQPVGLAVTSGIGNVPVGVNGGPVTAAHLIALESAVSAANGDVGALAFLTNSGTRAKLRAVPELSGGSLPIWRDGVCLGYPATASNQVSSTLTKGTSVGDCSAIFFGNWAALIVAEFGGAMEVVYDEYTQKKQGMIEMTSFASYDVVVSTLGSFAAVLDAT